MRKTLSGISSYQVKPEPEDIIRLDSNEACASLLSYVDFSGLEKTLINRYPAESTEALVEAYSKFSGFPKENVLAGNGSDECITLICQYALDPGDTVMVLDPDFSMYEKNARIMGANVEKIALNDDFSMPLSAVLEKMAEKQPKLFFLSSPNNPTGRQYEQDEIEQILSALHAHGGVLVLDEAYIDFAGESPFAPKLLEYENLIILRTASKALGMAALRLGFLAANDRLMEGIGAVKPPYNVNTVSAQIGTQLLRKPELLDQFLIMQLAQIAELEEILKEFADRVNDAVLYPSSTNFFLLKFNRAKELADFLYERKIKIRYFGGELAAVRISAGTKDEHATLRAALTEWSETYARSIL
jgi:histidinol-phosphate aminotransferase